LIKSYSKITASNVYILESHRAQGIGAKLLDRLITSAQQDGLHTLLSRIAGESQASIRLHEKFGFFHVGTMKEVGKKFGRLLDVHLMQKLLRAA
jgi:L-amino acid N-acyltransferase